jgi:hypothetical protein
MRRPVRIVLAAVLLCSTLSLAPAASTAGPPAASSAVAVASYTPPQDLKVAIVRSQTTLTWLKNRGTANRYPHSGKEIATLAYLRSRGYNVTEIVGDRDLLNMDTLRQYDVIVMPLVFAISMDASKNLVRYVAEGGGLVSSLSSPRARPEKANRPGTKNDMREWWWRQYKSNDWEWGPLSQVYQARFANDGFTPSFKVHPLAANQVTKGAQEILDARGYSDDVSGMSILRDPGSGLELSKPIAADPNASSTASFQILDTKVRKRYPSTYAAAITARYHLGRSVYFYFSVTDYLPTYSTVLYTKRTPSGTPQGEVAGAMLESAIKWAGTDDGVQGATTSRVAAYANVKAGSSGISSALRVRNYGPLITTGTLRLRIYDAKGRLVHTYARKHVSTQSGTLRKFSDYWGHSTRSGPYTVKVSYDIGHPLESAQATSSATVRRGGTATTH